MSEARAPSLTSHLAPHTRRIVAGVVLLLATNTLDKAIPWLLQHAIDALRSGQLDVVRDFSLSVIGLAFVLLFVRTGSRVVLFNIGRDVEYELRQAILSRIHTLGPAILRRMGTGEVMSRAINDLGQVRLMLGFGILNVINSVFAYVAGIGLMIAISPRLALYALVPYPLFILITRWFARQMFRRSQSAQKAIARLSDRAQESLAGVRIVRAFALEEHEERRFDEANREAIDANMSLVTLRGLMFPVLASVGSIGTLIVVWFGGGMVLSGELTVGQFAAFSFYLGSLVWPTLALGYILSIVQRGRASYARVRELLDLVPDVADAPDAKPMTVRGELDVAHLSYSHGAREVLHDVSLHVPAGGSLALVGPTGSGKSTLAALLPRLLPTPAGTVRIDGEDVTGLRLQDVRRGVGFAQQEPFLFSTTIARNIGFSLDSPDAPDALDRVRGAAREASIEAEIDSLGDGFDTVVGERGVQLSGGQKQRIALARAILAAPSVLVLDDPLSAVDARTEKQILDALDRVGEGRTVVLVTNRVAAASRCREIVVLEAGRVTERGTHEELLAKKGLYARIAEKQTLEAELSAL